MIPPDHSIDCRGVLEGFEGGLKKGIYLKKKRGL
jgi:hypothetical protein